NTCNTNLYNMYVDLLCSLVIYFDCSAFHSDLHSFPTRRSSDLGELPACRPRGRGGRVGAAPDCRTPSPPRAARARPSGRRLGMSASVVYKRVCHAAHHEPGAGARGHDLEQWDSVQEWRDPRPECVPRSEEH